MTSIKGSDVDLIARAVEDVVRDIVREEGSSLRLPQFLSTRKAAQLADVSTKTIRQWVKHGELDEYRAGNDLRILLTDLVDYLSQARGRNAIDLDAKVKEMIG